MRSSASVRLTMDALHPCGLLWGPEHVLLFNDAAAPYGVSLWAKIVEAGMPAR